MDTTAGGMACISRDMLQKDGVFVTNTRSRTICRKMQETFPFQEVHSEVNSYDVKKCSFWLEFLFFADGRQVSVERQQIVIANHAKQITALRALVIKRIKRLEMQLPGKWC